MGQKWDLWANKGAFSCGGEDDIIRPAAWERAARRVALENRSPSSCPRRSDLVLLNECRHESEGKMDFNEVPDATLFLDASLHLVEKNAFTCISLKQADGRVLPLELTKALKMLCFQKKCSFC